ncbi:BgTH12-04168 [Blumeria graminis f. sp. triticale]|uniref:Bgt-3034 n=3 Tax=Blumeria graminis TaxID=34373 RepID=A0A381LD25_BLUGR|nr:hypothetical protein BGT96224_3034 [Blumeria graminis f. sp. tritici 96224]CAD6500063.1 BgTH12-04168 [Blumeria graminis f. sp. triticale]VCU40248.1 Bgt-3034 [Blumeria graminis f. sp. tritici]
MADPATAKEYYGYLFKDNKQPTKILDALLRGIAIHIIENVGNVQEKWLMPEKMAAFYKIVGGNYDSLFVNVPPSSISWIYTSIGCQHLLLPTADDFTPPSIPSLTVAGFVRWQSIEILLGPDEHVPFIQKSLRLFHLRHPDTNEPFPVELPTESFPSVPDAEIEAWHGQCAQRLRTRVSPAENEGRIFMTRHKVQTGYAKREPYGEQEAETDYFNFRPKNRSRPSQTDLHKSEYNRPRNSFQYTAQQDPIVPKIKISKKCRKEVNHPDFKYPSKNINPEIHEIIVEEEPVQAFKSQYESIRRRHTLPRRHNRKNGGSDTSSDEREFVKRDSGSREKYSRARQQNDPTIGRSRSYGRKDYERKLAENPSNISPSSLYVSPVESRTRYKHRVPIEEQIELNGRKSQSRGENLNAQYSYRSRVDDSQRRRRSGSHGANLRWKDLLDETTAALWRGK